MEFQDNLSTIRAALAKDPQPLIEWATERLAALGAKREWSMDDNFNTTESLVALATSCGLPSAGDQSDEALRFYGKAAQALGYDADIDDEPDEDETEAIQQEVEADEGGYQEEPDGAPREQWEVTTPPEVYMTDEDEVRP